MKQIHGVRISHQTIINYVNGVSALVKDMIIITDYSIKLNTSKAKNDFDALIKFRKLYSDFLSSFSLSSIECTCGSHNWHMHSSYSRCYDFLGRKIKVSIQRIICAHAARLMLCLLENMKKYAVIVDEDYQAFNENCNITLDEIDLKIQALNKELEGIKNIALKNYDILDKLFELRHVDF